jgi:hypothetical protein
MMFPSSRQRPQRRRMGGRADAGCRTIKGKVSRIYFRADAGFANPDVYEFLEAERIKYAIRLPANRILQEDRPSAATTYRATTERSAAFLCKFTYQAGSWSKPRRVVAKVEWHLGELYPRVGFIVTARASNVGVDGPRRHRLCQRSLQISDNGDRPWNRLAELAWTRRSIFSSFME